MEKLGVCLGPETHVLGSEGIHVATTWQALNLRLDFFFQDQNFV
jgi:hypothetical protein